MAEPAPHAIRFLRLARTGNAVRKQLGLLDNISGVQGWMVGTSMGEVLFTSMGPTFILRMLDAIGDHVVHLTTDISSQEPSLEMEINFTQGNLLAHKIGNGWLIVFCDPQADLAMARMTLGLTANTLGGDRSLQKDLTSPVKSFAPDSSLSAAR